MLAFMKRYIIVAAISALTAVGLWVAYMGSGGTAGAPTNPASIKDAKSASAFVISANVIAVSESDNGITYTLSDVPGDTIRIFEVRNKYISRIRANVGDLVIVSGNWKAFGGAKGSIIRILNLN